MTHHNSTAALNATATVRIERNRAVRACYEQHGPLTDRAVAELLFGPGADPNKARPRITEAVQAGELVEEAERFCTAFAKLASVYRK